MLIDFMTNNLDANEIMMGERGVPISSAIREALKPKLSETEQAIFDLLDYSQTHSSPIDNRIRRELGKWLRCCRNWRNRCFTNRLLLRRQRPVSGLRPLIF